MDDLTVVMGTANLVPEEWANFHRTKLFEAIGDTQVITISKRPLDWGINLIQEGYGLTNLYYQVLRGARIATTPYIATCDDDTLYPKEHYMYRPPMDRFAYNFNRWHMLTWGEPFYFHKPRAGGGLLIASRDLVIKALEARFSVPLEESGELPGRLCHELGERGSLDCDKAKGMSFYTSIGVVSFYHENSIDPANRARRKRVWPVRAFDIPHWGRAVDLKKFWK